MYIIISIAILFLCVHFLSIIFIRTISDSWSTRQHEIDSTLANSIHQKFQALLSIPVTAAESLAKDSLILKSIVSKNLSTDKQEKIFLRFSQFNSKGNLSIALYDSIRQLVAYHNREIPLDTIDIYKTYSSATIKIIRGTLFTYIAVFTPLQQPSMKNQALLVTALPLEISFPLHNRFLQSGGFRNEIKSTFGIDLILDFAGTSSLHHDARYIRIDLENQNNALLGNAYFLKTNPTVHLQFIDALFERIKAFLLFVGLILFSIRIFKLYLYTFQNVTLKIVSITIHLWVVRYCFLWFDAAIKLLPEDLFDPVHFASPFGFGAVRSLGELVISCIILFINVMYVWNLIQKVEPTHYKRAATKRIFYSLGFIILVFIIPLLVRGYGATIQSFVFDSSYNFDDVASIFRQPLLWLMLFCAFVVTACFIIGFSIVIIVTKRFLGNLFTKNFKRFFFASAASLIVYAFFYFYTQEFIYPFYIYLIVGMSVIGVMFSVKLQSRLIAQRSVILILFLLSCLSLIMFVPTLELSMKEKRMETAVLVSSEFAQSVDGWSKVLVSQTLARIESDSFIGDDLREDSNEDIPEIAFHAWSHTPLSNEPNNSSICIYDQHGHLRSLFSIGIPQWIAKQEEIVQSIIGKDTSYIFHYSSRELKKINQIYIGLSPIRNSDSEIVGTIVIALMAGDKMHLVSNRTDILRNTSEQKGIAPEDDFIISQFENDTLITSTNPNLSKTIALPDSVRIHIQKNVSGIWGVLPFENASLKTFFAPRIASSGHNVIAVSIPQAEFLFTMYRISRFALIFFICALILFSGLLIKRIKQFVHHPQISFASKLRVSFIVIALIPIVIFWGSSKEFSREQTNNILRQKVYDGLNLNEANILQNVHGPLTKENFRTQITNQFCGDIAAFTGNEVNFYIGASLLASSKPELYFTNLLNPQLQEEAYVEIILHEKDFFVANETIGEFSYLVGYKPIRDGNGQIVAVLSTPTIFEQNMLEREYVRSSANIFMWSFIVLFLILGVSVLFSNQIAKPVHELTIATKDIALGDLSRKIETKRNDEIGELISSFNVMTDRLAESQKELAKAERELAWKEMAKQVAHEIRNPLTPMKLAAQHLLKAYKDGASNLGKLIEQVTATIIEQVETLARISTEFSHFARMPDRQIERVQINLILQETIKMFSHHANIHFQTDLSDNLPIIVADRDELQRGFINLIRNAVQSIQHEGTISVQSSHDEKHITVIIRDTGTGIDSSVLPNIFEPNFSTKTEGMGLGLSIVKKILDDLQASINITSNVHEGTTVIIEFPLQLNVHKA